MKAQGSTLANALLTLEDDPAGTELPSAERAVDICYSHLKDTFDPSMGGFGHAPKFPQPGQSP